MVKLTVAVERKGIDSDILHNKWYQGLATATREAGYDLPKSISIALIDDERMRAINKQTRNIDRITDVLSFLYNENEGELLIDPYQAGRQYKRFRSKTLKDEMRRLTIHGYLHLAGLDHATQAERRVMQRAERKTLLIAKKL